MEPRCCTVGPLLAARPGRGAQATFVLLVPGSLGGAALWDLDQTPLSPEEPPKNTMARDLLSLSNG